jgi:putative transposase
MARPKHRTKPGGTYFITTDTWERRQLFRKPDLAAIVEEKLFEYRGRGFFQVHGYVIMPDHLHAILTPGQATSLEKAVQLIKGGSSRAIGSRFPIWQSGFTEHLIRDEEDFRNHMDYIHINPVKAGLTRRAEEYPFGSAQGRFRPDPWPTASGAKAPSSSTGLTAGLKPRPSKGTPKAVP